MVDSLTPRQLDTRLRSDEPPLVVDVREDWEREIASIPGSLHVPMGEIPGRLDDLPADRDLVLQCHHGARSLQAAMWLERQGYRVANLDGGIDGWSTDVDQETSRYS
jgi:rhodanese-related sulfurtransferase